MQKFRDKSGKFILKGEEKRKVRTVRLTDSTWNRLGRMAEERGITRTELIEELLEQDNIDAIKVVEILKKALTLKANTGGAIKNQIRKALLILTTLD